MIHEHIIRYDDTNPDEVSEFAVLMKAREAFNALWAIREMVHKAYEQSEYENGANRETEDILTLEQQINNEIYNQGIDLDLLNSL